MKTAAFVAITALAALSAPTSVSADECSTTTLLLTLLPLLSDSNLSTCSSDSGYTIYPFAGLPTSDELTLICASDACTEILAAAVALDLPDCTIEYDGVEYNVKEELEAYATLCGVSSS